MRSRFSIFIIVALVVALLVALNAASYVRVEREPELEMSPDRSSSNAGPTGTRAVFDYLEATGHKVMRWRAPTEELLKDGGAAPSTFVVIGMVRRHFTDEEKRNLMRWVARGGRLVVIDRAPLQTLPAGGRWGVAASSTAMPGTDTRADDAESLVAGAKTVEPTQPTLLAAGVERVAPSRFAARLRAIGMGEDKKEGARARPDGDPKGARPSPSPTPGDAAEDEDSSEASGEEPPPRPTPRRGSVGTGQAHPEDAAEPDAPVFNFTDERGALLADYTRGLGHVIVLSDPFIVANNGIARADNLQLATNVIAGGNGLIAFDEFHQGRGETHNEFVGYFAGTPVIAIFGQLALIAVVVVWSRGRRFARPLPALRPDRRSKLEFVASMAELQQRARAFDLALENIYSRTRRALARYGGTDAAAPRAEIAAAVSARSGTDRARLETLMRDCEDAAAGEHVTAKRALALAAQLRELERALGIRMRSREIRQAERR
jgi:hypothetical protein